MLVAGGNNMGNLNELISDIIAYVGEHIAFRTDDPNMDWHWDDEGSVKAKIKACIDEYVNEVKETIKTQITDLLEDVC